MARISITAFIGAVVLYFISLYLYIPILPAFVAARTASLAAVGLVLSMYGLWTAILRMPMGIAADATGWSRLFLGLGPLLAGAGAAVMLSGRSIGSLALGRALTGAAAAAWVPMMAVFAGYFAPRQAIFATSLLSFASSLGQMIGTGSTGFVESLGGYGLTFLVALGFSAAGLLIFVLVKLPRPAASRAEPLKGAQILEVLRRRDVLVPSLANALCQFGVWALTFGFMPLLVKKLGGNAGVAGLIMTLNIAANTAANLFATFAANRGPRRLMLYLSFAVFAVGALLAAFGATLGLLFASTLLMGLANGLFFPILLGLSIQRVEGSRRSTAMGIHQAIYAVGMFTGPWVGGIVADTLGLRAMFGLVGVFCFVGPGSLMLLHREIDGAEADRG